MFGALPATLLLDLAKTQGAYTQMELDLDCPPWIFVDPVYLTSVATGHDIIQSNGKHTGVVGSKDHPYFTDTRNWLARNGYIDMQTQWHNGDRVLKPFYFNNVYLGTGTQFSCAAAMHYSHGKPELYNGGKPLPAPNYITEQLDNDAVWPEDIKQASFPESIDYVDDELDDLF